MPFRRIDLLSDDLTIDSVRDALDDAEVNDLYLIERDDGKLQASIVLAVATLLAARTDLPLLSIVSPDTTEWVLLLLMGAVGTLAHLFMTWSLRLAPSATRRTRSASIPSGRSSVGDAPFFR